MHEKLRFFPDFLCIFLKICNFFGFAPYVGIGGDRGGNPPLKVKPYVVKYEFQNSLMYCVPSLKPIIELLLAHVCFPLYVEPRRRASSISSLAKTPRARALDRAEPGLVPPLYLTNCWRCLQHFVFNN